MDRMHRMNVNRAPEQKGSIDRRQRYSINKNSTERRANAARERANRNQSNYVGNKAAPNPNPSNNSGKIDQGRGATRKTGQDFRNKSLKESLLKMERALGVRKNGERCVSSDLPIVEFIKEYNTYLKTLNRADKQKGVVALQSGLSSYQLLFNHFRYYREIRVSFEGFEGMDEIVKVLQMFRWDIDNIDSITASGPRPGRHKVKSQKIMHINRVLTVLNLVDSKTSKARHNNYAYRFLRLFCITVLYGDFVTASVLADTLLDQIVMEQRLRRRKVG